MSEIRIWKMVNTLGTRIGMGDLHLRCMVICPSGRSFWSVLEQMSQTTSPGVASMG